MCLQFSFTGALAIKKIEWHILGNHLFANAKALVFAGLFFQGKEANAWLVKGSRILSNEVPEQILPDGGISKEAQCIRL